MSRPAIFVTGAAAGIGAATARRFAARGWFVGLYDVNEGGVVALRAELGEGNAVAGRLDVTDHAAFAQRLSEFFAAAGNRLDLMFNNAGIVAVGDFESLPLARHHAIVDVNVKGVINGCQLAYPYLARTPGARVINMCSASAVSGVAGFAVYGASKFFVRGLTEALNIEWARHGIAVSDLMPLFVDTPMVAQFDVKPRSFDLLGLRLTADDVATTVWRAAHRSRRWPRIHWLMGLQGWALWLSVKLSPAWLTRLTNRWLTGY